MNALELALPAGRRRWRSALLALVALWLAIGLLFGSTFVAMVGIWSRSDTFAHAFMVPPIALWLAWRQRAAVLEHVPRSSPWWLLPMAATAVLWLLGDLVAVNAAKQLAITAMLVISVPLILGTRIAAVLIFPLSYLFFAVPIGEFMLQPLMQATADFTVAALRLSGVPVYREGLQFVIPTGSWSVVEACSGVRYLMASFMVGTLFGYLNYRSARKRWIFAAVSLAMPVIANWLRAYLIVMLGHLSGNKLAVGADHLVYGWVFFGVLITLLFMIGARWADDRVAEPQHVAGEGDASGAAAGLRPSSQGVPSSRTWQSTQPWAASALAILVLLLPHAAVSRFAAPGAAGPVPLALDAVPSAPGWRLQAGGAAAAWQPSLRQPSAEVRAQFAGEGPGGGDVSVNVYLAYYRNQDDNRKLVSSNNALVSSSDRQWNVVRRQRLTLSLGGRDVGVRQLQLQPAIGARDDAQTRYTVWQVYWINGVLTDSDVHAKLVGAWQRLRGMPDESAAIVLYAADPPDARAEPALRAFAAANWHTIERALAAARDGP
jgi:exosortase A